VPVRRPSKPYASRVSGWSIDLGAPWMELRGFKDGLPAAEYGASCGDDSVVVASVPLLGHRPPLDAAVPALLSLLEVRDAQDLPRRPLRVGSWSGSELPYQQKINGRWMKVRLWVLVGDEAALVAAERRPPEQPENECADPLERLAVGAARPLRADAVQDRQAAARFFVDVARRLRSSRRVAESAAYFAEAGALAPDDPGHLLDEVRLLQQAGRRDEAMRRIAARLHGAPCASAVRVRAAQLLADLGRAPEAIATWTSAFGCGYRDPDALSDYLRFLEREGRLTLAFHEAQRFADPADLPRLRGQLAAGDRQ
jgi:tetratricopeptide (TPR) repeat protein